MCSPDIYLSTQLFVSVHIHEHLLYILGYNLMLLYFVTHSVPALAIWSSGIWLWRPYDAPAPFSECVSVCSTSPTFWPNMVL